jgi:hypothetical protein
MTRWNMLSKMTISESIPQNLVIFVVQKSFV